MAKVTLDKNGLAKSAGTLTIYNFDAVSGEFTGSSNEFLVQGVGLPAPAFPRHLTRSRVLQPYIRGANG